MTSTPEQEQRAYELATQLRGGCPETKSEAFEEIAELIAKADLADELKAKADVLDLLFKTCKVTYYPNYSRGAYTIEHNPFALKMAKAEILAAILTARDKKTEI